MKKFVLSLFSILALTLSLSNIRACQLDEVADREDNDSEHMTSDNHGKTLKGVNLA